MNVDLYFFAVYIIHVFSIYFFLYITELWACASLIRTLKIETNKFVYTKSVRTIVLDYLFSPSQLKIIINSSTYLQWPQNENTWTGTESLELFIIFSQERVLGRSSVSIVYHGFFPTYYRGLVHRWHGYVYSFNEAKLSKFD